MYDLGIKLIDQELIMRGSINKKVMVTNTSGRITVLISAAACIYILYSLLFTEPENIGLSVALFLVFFALGAYFSRFIEMAFNEENGAVTLYSLFKKEIQYTQITRISFLPIISRSVGVTSSIYLLTYIDENDKNVNRLISVRGLKSLILERIIKDLGV